MALQDGRERRHSRKTWELGTLFHGLPVQDAVAVKATDHALNDAIADLEAILDLSKPGPDACIGGWTPSAAAGSGGPAVG
jgi:hypothetical protein